MRDYFLFAGMALCLFSLWAIARHDWLRLTTISRQAVGTVIGHKLVSDGEGRNWAPIYRFSAEGRDHEVTDQVSSGRKQPPEGATAKLVFPHGRPDLARPPRLLMWLTVYAFLIALFCVLFSVWMGWLRN
ncbi:MAG: hypothetical protein ACKOPO_10975 [Novosphingobium sp.]